MLLIKKKNNLSINELKQEYNLIDIHVYDVVFDMNLLICFVQIKNIQSLDESWREINIELSEYLEEYIKNNLTRWNIYIIYLVDDKVSKELQYKIENDTFFSRKIVEDNYTLDLSDENIKKLIEKHITFNDIELISTSQTSEHYFSKSKVYLKLKDLDSIDSAKIDEILNSLEEGIKNEI